MGRSQKECQRTCSYRYAPHLKAGPKGVNIIAMKPAAKGAGRPENLFPLSRKVSPRESRPPQGEG